MKARRPNIFRNRLGEQLQGGRGKAAALKHQGEQEDGARDAAVEERNHAQMAQSMLESGMSVSQVVGALGLDRSMNSVDALRSASDRVRRETERRNSVPGAALQSDTHVVVEVA